MLDISFLLKVSRPRFWIYVFGPYIIGLVAAIANRNELLNWRVFIFGLYFTLPANLLIYGINDIFDYETDKLNAKKSDYETLVTPERRRSLGIVIAALNLPFIAVAGLGVRHALFALAVFLFLSVFYSAPPIRAKAKPLLDSAFNVLYIMPGVFAYVMLNGNIPPVELVVAGGCWTAAMHAFSAIPDIGADREAGLPTIATTLGSSGTHLFCLAAYIISAVLSFRYLGYAGILIGLIYAVMMLFSMLGKDKEAVFEVYRRFPLVNAGIGFAIFWYVAIPKFF